MNRRMILTALVGAVCFASVGTAQAVTLVTPQGTPIGNPWQAWANASAVPTYPGVMTLDISAADAAQYCTEDGYTPDGCSDSIGFTPGASTAIPETIIAPTLLARYDLMYEQGHIVDWMTTTDTERVKFRLLLGIPLNEGWWSGEYEIGYGTAPPAELWSEGYQLCATNSSWTAASLSEFQVWRMNYPKTVRLQQLICNLMGSRQPVATTGSPMDQTISKGAQPSRRAASEATPAVITPEDVM